MHERYIDDAMMTMVHARMRQLNDALVDACTNGALIHLEKKQKTATTTTTPTTFQQQQKQFLAAAPAPTGRGVSTFFFLERIGVKFMNE